MVKNLPAVGDLGRSLGWGDSLEKKRLPLQYSGLENFMNCIIHGVSKSRTQLNDFHFQELKEAQSFKLF